MTTQELLIEKTRYDSNRRWWYIAVLLGIVIFLNQNRELFEYWPVLSVIGLAAIYNFVLSVLAYHKQVAMWIAYLEIGVDSVLIAGLIHFTGGILASPLFILAPLFLVMLAYQRSTQQLAAGIGTIALAFTACIFLGGAPDKSHFLSALDRLGFLIMISTATLAFSRLYHRNLEKSKTALADHGARVSEITRLNEKLQSKIMTSTQKLEEVNVMLVKKNLAMMALHEIYMAMNSTFNSTQLLNMVLDTAMSLLKASAGCLLLADPLDRKFKIKVARGIEKRLQQNLEIRSGEGLEGLVVRSGKEQLISDLSRFSDYQPLAPDSRCKMCTALRIKNKIVGLITVESSKLDAFSKSDLDLLTTLGSQASEVLQNVELYEEMRNKADGLSLLFEIGKDISTIFNLKRLFAATLERSLQVMKARHGTLMIYDKERDKLAIRASVGLADGAEAFIRVDSGIAGWVFRNNRSVILPSVKNTPLYDAESDYAYAGQTLIASPLSIRKKVFGVICLNDRTGRSFTRDDLKLLNALAAQAAIAIENVELYASIRRDYLNVIKALAAAVDAKDHYTHGHSNKVMAYSAMIAKELNLSDKEIEKIKYGALLHDVGKIGISEAVLNKPTKLTSKEFDTIAMHPILGLSIVKNIETLKDLLPVILYHHERFSGGGYPEGISGQAIPLGARIVAVADSWDVMTSDRAYRKALPQDMAVAELKKCSGTQFDPEVVEALLKALQRDEKIDTFKIEEEMTHLALDEEEISRLME